MNDNIIPFIGLNDEDIEVLDMNIENGERTIHIRKILTPTYCPVCNYRMHSKGIHKRTVNHPITQDGITFKICIHQREWRCTNQWCRYHCNDEFTFVQKNKRNSNITPFLILDDMRDLSLSVRAVAQRFDVSDTYVHNIFLQYVRCERLPLPEYLCIDEVYLYFDEKNKYALVLMDFMTGVIIDILPNRLKTTYSSYFHRIPLEERRKVKAVVCDMYNPYVNFAPRYFPNAMVIVDSFHVIQWMNNKINNRILELKRKYKKRDEERQKQLDRELGRETKNIEQSAEVYILNNFRWILLTNQFKFERTVHRKYNRFFKQHLDVYDIESMFLSIDESFPLIQKLKYLYDEFNSDLTDERDEKEKNLQYLIDLYKSSECDIFIEFSGTLAKYKEEILNSFTLVPSGKSELHEETIKETEENLRRLSNGPMEGFNRKPKDLKRNSRGFKDMEFTIKRILWSNRKDEMPLAVPKPKRRYSSKDKKKRGPYKRKKR